MLTMPASNVPDAEVQREMDGKVDDIFKKMNVGSKPAYTAPPAHISAKWTPADRAEWIKNVEQRAASVARKRQRRLKS